MTIITGITDQANQQFTVRPTDGTRVRLTLNYRVQQAGWFLDLLWTKANDTTFEVLGLRVTTSPNILRKWKDILSFGLSVVTDANMEPTEVKAFSGGTTKLMLLDAAEVEEIEELVFSGLSATH